jgi:dTMP kinase
MIFPRSTDTAGVRSDAGVWRAVADLERDGAVHSDAGMTSPWIIPAFYPLEYDIRKLFPAFPCPGVEKLQLHRVPERFRHRIVVITITDSAHRAKQPVGFSSASTTTAALVSQRLAAAGLQVRATGEPSRTPLGEMIRASTDLYRGMALACLVAGDRHHHLATEIRPQRRAGAIVICDRYLPSGLVLQRMDGVGWDTIWQLNAGAETPDLAVILNAAPAVLASRLTRRGAAHSRFERLPDGSASESDRQRRLRASGRGVQRRRLACHLPGPRARRIRAS